MNARLGTTAWLCASLYVALVGNTASANRQRHGHRLGGVHASAAMSSTVAARAQQRAGRAARGQQGRMQARARLLARPAMPPRPNMAIRENGADGVDTFRITSHGEERTYRFARGATGRPGITVQIGNLEQRVEMLLVDIDGMLVDTRSTIAGGIRAGAEEVDIPLTDSQVAELTLGLAYTRIAVRLLGETEGRGERGRRFVDRAASTTAHLETRGNAPPFRDTVRLIEAFASRGVPIAAVTSRPTRQALLLLGRTNRLLHRFSAIIGTSDQAGGETFYARRNRSGRMELVHGVSTDHKPHPAPIFEALATEGVHPDRAMMLGDMPTDVASAEQAHVASVAVTHGFGTPQALAAEQPDATVHDIGSILRGLRP